MKKNHWHTAGSKKRQAAYKYGYKSGLELTVASKHKYTPDFVFTKRDGTLMYIETKGRWTATDRKKMKHVLKSNPNIDIRIVFQSPNQKISKGSKTTYEAYAIKMGIPYVAKKEIPVEWMEECLKPGEEVQDPKRFFV